MSSVSNDQVIQLFKKVWGKLNDLQPSSEYLAKKWVFDRSAMVGDSFIESFALTNETGWTIAGDAQDAFQINAAIAGTIKQSNIKPSQVVLSSIIPWATMSRGASGAGGEANEKVFYNATKWVMKNHIKSHAELREKLRFYGQSASGLGYVSYAASGTVYRGATYSGSGNVVLNGITFAAGIDATNKHILLAPGEFASGLWVGCEGAIVNQVATASGLVVASGKLVKVNSKFGYITVDFTPIAASGLTSHKLVFQGMEDSKDPVGIQKILSNTGSLFGISAAQYSLWQATAFPLGSKKLNLKAIQLGVADAVNAGGLTDPLEILVNPRTFAVMSNDEASLRNYNASVSKAQNGFEAIEYWAANGLNMIVPHRMVKEGEAFGLVMGEWLRSGSAEIGFNIPGPISQEVIFPLENQAGWVVRSFSDEYILCRKPAIQIYFSGINDEGTDF